MFDRNIITTFLVISVITVIISYFVISTGFYSISADESTRTLMAYQWFKNGVIENTSWLPLHFIILGFGFYLLQDLFLLPRIISILFGLFTIAAAGALTFTLFRNKTSTIIAMILCAFLPQKFILSIIPLPEIIYIFFITWGAYFLYKYLISGAIKPLLLTSLLWSIAALLRYESWFFLFSLSIFLLIRLFRDKRKPGPLVIVILVNSLIPFLWILYNLIQTGNGLYFLKEPSLEFSSVYNAGYVDLKDANPLYQFFDQNLLSLNLLGICGLYFVRHNKPVLKWTIITYLPLFILSIISLTGKTLPAHNFWRIPAVWSILLIPFTALTVSSIKSFTQKSRIIIQSSIVLLLVFQFSLNTFSFIKLNTRRYTFNEGDMTAGKYFVNYIKDRNYNNSRILIETLPSYEHFNITLASQEPFRFIYSEKDKLKPVKSEKYVNIPIDYYLVKSYSKVRELKRSHQMKAILHYNNWTLFQKLY